MGEFSFEEEFGFTDEESAADPYVPVQEEAVSTNYEQPPEVDADGMRAIAPEHLGGAPEEEPFSFESEFGFEEEELPVSPEEEAEPGYWNVVGQRIKARGKSLLGDYFGAGQKFSETLEDKAGMGGLWIDSEGVSWLNAEEWAAKVDSGEMREPLEAASEYWKEGVEDVPSKHTWEGLKQKFADGDIAGGIAETFLYGTETGLASIPDMVGVLTTMPAYITARANEMGEIRAENKGKEKADITDMLEAYPGAIASALFEKFGAKGMTDEIAGNLGTEALKHGFKNAAKNIGKGGVRASSKEAFTEFVQEGIIEYGTEKLGTGAAMSFAEAGERGLAGAVSGGTFGGTTGVGGATVKQFTDKGEVAGSPGPMSDLENQ